MPKDEAMTAENFDFDDYVSRLIEEGYRDDAAKEKAQKKKESLDKNESNFEYIMKLESFEKGEDLIVAGFASNGNVDWDDEAINKDSLQAAWSDYMGNPVLRYMHGKDSRHPDAIGVVIPEYIKENGEIIKTEFRDGKPFIVAKISNASDVGDIRTKIKEGVVKGFSIGGRANRVPEFCHKLSKNINRIFIKRLSEISIVDLPANKEGFFEIVKGCVGEDCSCEIELNDSKTIIADDNKNIDKSEEKNMSDNIEMEMPELVDLIKSTVGSMIEDQETVEKVEGYDSAIKTIQDLKARIAELEAKVTAQAAQLKANPEAAMKSEDADAIEETDEEKKKREAKEADKEKIGKLEAEIAELKAVPMNKSEQVETVEKTETPIVSHLSDVIKAHYGGI